MLWLFMSGRLTDEEKDLKPLGNTHDNTPASALAKKLSEQI
jgi:hypothetical protein